MQEFLAFKKMITPIIIIVVFWIGVVGCVIAGLVQIGGGMSLGGLIVIVLGPILVRIYCEILMVIFGIHGTLINIKELLERQNTNQ